MKKLWTMEHGLGFEQPLLLEAVDDDDGGADDRFYGCVGADLAVVLRQRSCRTLAV